MPTTGGKSAKTDADYFDRMSKAIFAAGLNWRVIENKWPGFRRAFAGFAPQKVAAMTEKDVLALMKNTDVVRNERKIRATVQNAKTMLQLKKEFGSMEGFIGSFGKHEAKLLESLQEKFKHLGPSSARMFLWMAKYPLTPTKEEKTWMKGHHDRHEIHQ